jgi:hypothetical protein
MTCHGHYLLLCPIDPDNGSSTNISDSSFFELCKKEAKKTNRESDVFLTG